MAEEHGLLAAAVRRRSAGRPVTPTAVRDGHLTSRGGVGADGDTSAAGQRCGFRGRPSGSAPERRLWLPVRLPVPAARPPRRRESTTSTSIPEAAAAASSGGRNREIELTSRPSAARSPPSTRPKLWITFATGLPVCGCRSLCASCRCRTTDPSRFVRRLSRKYTDLRHHTYTPTVERHAQGRVPTRLRVSGPPRTL